MSSRSSTSRRLAVLRWLQAFKITFLFSELSFLSPDHGSVLLWHSQGSGLQGVLGTGQAARPGRRGTPSSNTYWWTSSPTARPLRGRENGHTSPQPPHGRQPHFFPSARPGNTAAYQGKSLPVSTAWNVPSQVTWNNWVQEGPSGREGNLHAFRGSDGSFSGWPLFCLGEAQSFLLHQFCKLSLGTRNNHVPACLAPAGPEQTTPSQGPASHSEDRQGQALLCWLPRPIVRFDWSKQWRCVLLVRQRSCC